MNDPYLDHAARRKMHTAISARTGSTATLRLMAGADLTGTVTSLNEDTIVLRVGAIDWTIPLVRVVALAV